MHSPLHILPESLEVQATVGDLRSYFSFSKVHLQLGGLAQF